MTAPKWHEDTQLAHLWRYPHCGAEVRYNQNSALVIAEQHIESSQLLKVKCDTCSCLVRRWPQVASECQQGIA